MTTRQGVRREHNRWQLMLRRCEDPSFTGYQSYGGRGITVCERWHDFENFYADIAAQLGPCPPGMSLDRVDNEGNYEPSNVRWASRTQQANNSRPVAAMYAKYARYCELRDSGLLPVDAAREGGMSYDTASRYERSYLKAHPSARQRPAFTASPFGSPRATA